jgi:chromate transporter
VGTGRIHEQSGADAESNSRRISLRLQTAERNKHVWISSKGIGIRDVLELFITFFKLGMFTIGGGVAMLPIMKELTVDKKGWFTEEEALDAISVCQTLPGVIAINLATYVGFKRKGLLGSFVCTVGVVLPSFVIIILIAKGLASFGDNPYVMGALGGLRAAAMGLVLIAVYSVTKGVIRDWFSGIASVVAIVLIEFTDISVMWVIVLFLIAGILRAMWNVRKTGGAE